jgi:hypothetical protein
MTRVRVGWVAGIHQTEQRILFLNVLIAFIGCRLEQYHFSKYVILRTFPKRLTRFGSKSIGLESLLRQIFCKRANSNSYSREQ